MEKKGILIEKPTSNEPDLKKLTIRKKERVNIFLPVLTTLTYLMAASCIYLYAASR